MRNELEYALELFDSGSYEQSVESLIKCYERGEEQGWIREFFYANFILPNEEEFKRNYSEQNLCEIPYVDLAIDFIPISDTKFFLFYKPENMFLGSFCVKKREIKDEKKEINSLLIADIWDLRDMIPYIKERNYLNVYIIPGYNINSFASFLKLPGILSEYLGNAVVFQDTSAMHTFFVKNHSYYLPRDILALDNSYYKQVLSQIRKERISGNRKNGKAVLSICLIGDSIANDTIDNISSILEVPYEYEIEIVSCCNNTQDAGEFIHKINKLAQSDSRVIIDHDSKYSDKVDMLCRALSKATGQYAVVLQDNALINIELLEEYLTFLINHPEMGIGLISGEIDNQKEYGALRTESRLSRIKELNRRLAPECITLNLQALEESEVIRGIERHKNNEFVRTNPVLSCAILMKECYGVFHLDEKIFGISCGDNTGVETPEYLIHSNIVEEILGLVELEKKELRLDEIDYIDLIKGEIRHIYYMLLYLYNNYGIEYVQEVSWDDAFAYAFNSVMRNISSEAGNLGENIIKELNQFNCKVFGEYYKQKPESLLGEEKIRLEFEVTAAVINYMVIMGKNPKDINVKAVKNIWKEIVI